jgi:hypothetical protein
MDYKKLYDNLITILDLIDHSELNEYYEKHSYYS